MNAESSPSAPSGPSGTAGQSGAAGTAGPAFGPGATGPARFRGVGVALITPFKADGSLDLERYEAHVERMIQGGVHVLVPCGTTGESATLSGAEQAEVIRAAVSAAAGRVPVMAGAGANSTAEAVQRAEAARKAGADAVMSVGPYYNKPPQEGLFRHFEAVARAAELPLFVYNVPGRTASNILPETILRLAAIDNVWGVKEASGDLAQIATILKRRPEGFLVHAGDDEFTLPVAALGGDGVVSVAGNEDPAGMARLAEACLRGDAEAARAEHFRLLELMRVNFVETNPVPVKTGVELLGHGTAHFRLPLVPMGAAGRARLEAILGELDLLP
ncbi:MAG: 4-hydroxy-tetrahydrodipicolinate synthase [Longimicrobiales bacterium]